VSAAEFEVYAIKFAEDPGAVRGSHFYGPEPRPLESHPTDYFVWLARSADSVVLVDAGYTAATAQRRNRRYLASPLDTLGRLGVAPEDVGTLVVSHLHWDHIGHVADLRDATVVVQERETQFVASRWAGRGDFRRTLEPDDVVHVLRRTWDGGARVVDGDVELVPGVSAHLVGGHTPGTQVVRVRTAEGWVVLASDAAHFYENIRTDRPFSIVNSLPSMYAAFDRINELADSPRLVVPGHDPAVMAAFPAVPGLEGLAVRVA
jgi:glyoxylase-like metal-dependent hydrolase (beta-lactamase superfamily II)